LIEILHSLVFALHLVCVNVATAGPLICIWLHWREAGGDSLAGRAGRYLAACSVLLLMVGSMVGIAVVAGLWTPVYRYALIERLSSKLFFGVWELIFSLVLLLIFVVWWKIAPKCALWLRWVRSLLALLAGTNLMYHFPFLFIIAGQLATEGILKGNEVNAADFRILMLNQEVLSRTFHFLIASVAMSGVMLIGYALRISRAGADSEDIKRVAIWGGRIALGSTLLQIPVGMWVMFSLPSDIQKQFMGGDMVTSGIFLLSVAAAFALMHYLASVAMGKTERKRLMKAIICMVLVIILMSVALRRSTSIAKPTTDQTGATLQVELNPFSFRVSDMSVK